MCGLQPEPTYAKLSIASRSSVKVVSSVAGLEKVPAPAVTGTVLLALLVAIVVDVSIRVTFSRIHSRIKREMYEALARVAVAKIFMGACVIMVIEEIRLRNYQGVFDFGFGPTLALIYWDPLWLQEIKSSIPGLWRITTLPTPLLFLFSGSLAVVLLKAFAIRGRIRKAFVGLLIIFIVPFVLLNMSRQLYSLVDEIMLPWSRGEICPVFISCGSSSGQISVSGYLTLSGQEKVIISADAIVIKDRSSGSHINARFPEDQYIVISSSSYTRIDFKAKYEPGDLIDIPSEGSFDCDLALRFNPVISGARPLQIGPP